MSHRSKYHIFKFIFAHFGNKYLFNTRNVPPCLSVDHIHWKQTKNPKHDIKKDMLWYIIKIKTFRGYLIACIYPYPFKNIQIEARNNTENCFWTDKIMGHAFVLKEDILTLSYLHFLVIILILCTNSCLVKCLFW